MAYIDYLDHDVWERLLNLIIPLLRAMISQLAWWHHQMEPFFVLLALCAENSQVTGEFPAQRPVMWTFDVFFDLHLNKRLSKQSWGWWFEPPWRPLWHHCTGLMYYNQSNHTDNQLCGKRTTLFWASWCLYFSWCMYTQIFQLVLWWHHEVEALPFVRGIQWLPVDSQ